MSNEQVTLSDGQTVEVRPPTAREYFDAQNASDKTEEQDVRLMAACVLDEKGKPAFTEDSAFDLSLPDYMAVYNAVIRACNPDEDAEKN